MNPQVTMLKDCLSIVQSDKLNEDKPINDPVLYEQFLQWLGYHLSLEAQITTPAFQTETHDGLRNAFSLELLQEDMWDWFGELANEVGLVLNGAELMQQDLHFFLSAFSKEMADNSKALQDKVVIDPNTGTGRMILVHARPYKDQLLFYGAEKEKLAYRTALLNCHIYGIKSFIVCADPALHDLSPSSKNWLAANMWQPLAYSDLLDKKSQ